VRTERRTRDEIANERDGAGPLDDPPGRRAIQVPRRPRCRARTGEIVHERDECARRRDKIGYKPDPSGAVSAIVAGGSACGPGMGALWIGTCLTRLDQVQKRSLAADRANGLGRWVDTRRRL